MNREGCLERYGYNVTRQSMGQFSEAALRNCFLGAYGFESLLEAKEAAIKALMDYYNPVDTPLYAEIYEMDTYNNEDLEIRQPLNLKEVIIYDPRQRYERAKYFNDNLFPDKYLRLVEDGSVEELINNGSVKAFAPPVSIQ